MYFSTGNVFVKNFLNYMSQRYVVMYAIITEILQLYILAVPVTLGCTRPRLYPNAEHTDSKPMKLLSTSAFTHYVRQVYQPIQNYVALKAVNHECPMTNRQRQSKKSLTETKSKLM